MRQHSLLKLERSNISGCLWPVKCPATFQRTLDILLSGLKWSVCLVHVDDIIVYFDTFENHPEKVDRVLTIGRDASLALNIVSCHLFKIFVCYLDHVVVLERLKVAQKHTSSIKKENFLTSQTELRSFLGMCNIYQHFVPKLSAVAEPLNQ